MKNFFLIGDFNINFISPSPLLTKLLDFTNSIGLSFLCTARLFGIRIPFLTSINWSSCRTISKLVLLYKFIFSKLYIPAGSFSFQNHYYYNLRSSHPLNLKLPFFRSSAILNSFLPSAISLWNSLPSSLKDLNSGKQFKQNISYLL